MKMTCEEVRELLGKEEMELIENSKIEMKNELCDYVAKGELICMTGSGVSNGLPLKDPIDDITKAPTWKQLLSNLFEKAKGELDVQKMAYAKRLIDAGEGPYLIEAASILRNFKQDEFDKVFKQSVTLESGAFDPKHMDILNLHPQGILTYNYDMAQENAFLEKYKSYMKVILPNNEDGMRDIYQGKVSETFLFKMHGTVADGSMVLTRETYRELLAKNPQYKICMAYLLTHYHFLILGFGMSDPDFDLMLQDVFDAFGSPAQGHILVKPLWEWSAKDYLYQNRYGIRIYYVNDYSEINKLIQECCSGIKEGTFLRKIVDDTVDKDITKRYKAHRDIDRLGQVGRECLGHYLVNEINNWLDDEPKDDENCFKLAEYVYDLGILMKITMDREYKETLARVIEKCKYMDPVCYAMLFVKDMLGIDANGEMKHEIALEDIKRAATWADKLSELKNGPARVRTYKKAYVYWLNLMHLNIAKYDITEDEITKVLKKNVKAINLLNGWKALCDEFDKGPFVDDLSTYH